MLTPLLGRSALIRMSKPKITGESVGTGDGATAKFSLADPPVLYHSETIYVDGEAPVSYTHLTLPTICSV